MQIADTWLKDIPQQFLGKHRIEVLISAFARQMQEVENVFESINTMTNLDVATGLNLDYVGTIIPLTRKEAGELAGIGVTDPVISDDRYRQFLRYKNLMNTNECTYYDLMDGLSLLWDVSPIYYIEDPDMPATIILTMPFLKPGGETVRLGEVPMVKPAGVRIEFQYLIRYAVETLVRWIYQVYGVPLCNQLLCGQHPRKGSLGQIMLLQTEIDLEEIKRIFALQKTGTIRIGGKLYDSTKGEIVTDDVEIAINTEYQIEELILSGQVVSGTHPVQSVNGFFMGTTVEAASISTAVAVDLPLSGIFPVKSVEGIMIGSSIEADRIVSNTKVNAPLSGTLVTSGTTEEKTLFVRSKAISAEPVVHIAAVTARRCGTGVCGNKS